MYLPSRLQKYCRMGRLVSAVTGFALSKGSAVRFTQTLRVPFSGFTKAMNCPSGEIRAPEISGSPKNNSRSINGGAPDDCAMIGCASASIDSATKANRAPALDLDNGLSVQNISLEIAFIKTSLFGTG